MYNYFASNLKDLLRISGKTQKDIAKYLNVKQNTISQWANGAREPDFDNLLKICNLFNTEPNEILGYFKAKNKIEIEDITKQITNIISDNLKKQ